LEIDRSVGFDPTKYDGICDVLSKIERKLSNLFWLSFEFIQKVNCIGSDEQLKGKRSAIEHWIENHEQLDI
jgi:hypothetical protein